MGKPKSQYSKSYRNGVIPLHYYLGGSLGGFYLVACWQYGTWHGVLAGGMILYGLIYLLCGRLHRCTFSQLKEDEIAK
jgi:hypothetical protein